MSFENFEHKGVSLYGYPPWFRCKFQDYEAEPLTELLAILVVAG